MNIDIHINCIIRYIADDKSRVRLSEIPGVEGSDYINASFIDVCKTYSTFNPNKYTVPEHTYPQQLMGHSHHTHPTHIHVQVCVLYYLRPID